MKLDKTLIDEFENEAQKTVENLDIKKDKLLTNHETAKKNIKQQKSSSTQMCKQRTLYTSST